LLWCNSSNTENALGLLLLDTNFNIIKKVFLLFLPPTPFFATEPSVQCGRNPIKTFFSEDKLMNKLIAILIAGTFALGSVAAVAQVPTGDKTPAPPVDQKALKAERDAKKAEAAKMTPEERAAAKKAKRAERQKELTTGEKTQQEGGASPKAQAEEGKKAADASKAQPKALPTKEDKQKALKEQEKKASGQ
jgi:uncharacterized membrane protein